jgi:tetratricopeptide (TPR) repeat protein
MNAEILSQLSSIQDLSQKLDYLSQQVRIYAQTDDLDTLAWLYEIIGKLCLEMGWYEEAMEAASRIIYLFRDDDAGNQIIELCNRASKLYSTAAEYHQNQYYTKEIETWIALLSEIPKDKNAWFNLGNAYVLKYEFLHAIEAYNQAEQFDFDGDSAIFLNRAYAHEKLENWHAAISDYTRMLELNIDDVRAWWNRAQVYIRLSKWEEAKNDLLQAYKRGEEEAMALIQEIEQSI